MWGPLAGAPMREGLAFLAKTILFVLGFILVVAALVQLSVGGIGLQALGVLALGLALAGPPLGFALRDALREARRKRRALQGER